MRLLVIPLILLATTSMLFSATIYVPDTFPLIQDAINAAGSGDTIIVRSGTYVENIDFMGKALTVKSENGPSVTEIDGAQSGACVTFISGEAQDSVIEGFTLWNGSGYNGSGGGVACYGASPTIKGNDIIYNASSTGGGISCQSYASPTIVNNTIAYNQAPGAGGGIFCRTGCCPFIFNNLITDNVVASATGGAMYIGYSSDAIISNNTIYGNSALNYGSIFSYSSSPHIANTISRGNSPNEIGGSVTVTYSNVEGGISGAGNIDTDPLFVDPLNGDFHLQQDPCQPGIFNPSVDAGGNTAFNLCMETCSTRTDGVPDDDRVDMGFHYGPYTCPGLLTDVYLISDTTGGSANLTLHAGMNNASRGYVILGSVTGFAPGIPLPGGEVLPVNWDPFTDIVIALMNSPAFTNFLGTLDADGGEKALFDTLGPLQGAVGLTFYFAFATYNPWNYASNPIAIQVVL